MQGTVTSEYRMTRVRVTHLVPPLARSLTRALARVLAPARRLALGLALGLGLDLALDGASAGAAVQAQSPMFRGEPTHRGVYDSRPPALAALAWKFHTGGRVISTPAVVGDAVYVGSTDGSLYALARADGSQRWKFDTRGPIASSPAVVNGLVIVSSVDGGIYAVDATSGAQRWVFRTKGERRFTAPGIHGAIPRTERMPDPFDVFLSSPTVVDGVVYVGSGDQHVYALDAASGALRWSFATGDVVHASPAVADGVVYIGSWDRNLYALDAATGRERWRYTTGSDTTIYNQVGLASSPAVSGGTVFVGGRDGHFHAVDARTGALKWKIDNNGGWTIASPAVHEGVVYFPTSDGRRFKGAAAATGEIVIDLQMANISFSSPAVAGGVVYFGTSDGFLNAVGIADRAFRGRFQTDGSKENGPRLLNASGQMRTDLMYPDRSLDGMMIGMRTMMTLGSVLSSPVIADGVAYFGSTDGHLYAVR
jgi:outer membrane protein assembly factor BamB